jgi:hypothetical protein
MANRSGIVVKVMAKHSTGRRVGKQDQQILHTDRKLFRISLVHDKIFQSTLIARTCRGSHVAGLWHCRSGHAGRFWPSGPPGNLQKNGGLGPDNTNSHVGHQWAAPVLRQR